MKERYHNVSQNITTEDTRHHNGTQNSSWKMMEPGAHEAGGEDHASPKSWVHKQCWMWIAGMQFTDQKKEDRPYPAQAPQAWAPSAGCGLLGCNFRTLDVSRGHSVCVNAVGFSTFPGVFEFLVRWAKISFRWGGGCVYFLKSVTNGRFRNVWVGGGGVDGHIFVHRAGNSTMHAAEQCTGDH